MRCPFVAGFGPVSAVSNIRFSARVSRRRQPPPRKQDKNEEGKGFSGSKTSVEIKMTMLFSSMGKHHSNGISRSDGVTNYIDETDDTSSYAKDSKDGLLLVKKLVQKSATNGNFHSEKEMDVFLAGELNQMSLEERLKVFEELHGVDDIVKETPEFLAERLDALEDAISRLHLKDAYIMAEEQSREYVHDTSFRLTFLRADLFDAQKAAKRLVTFFECRLSLFGRDFLTRKITIDDLDADDQTTLKSGYFQILPARDTTGRVVIANVQGMFKRIYKSAANMQRTFHYLFCSMVEDLETQVHGTVLLFYQIGSYEYDPPPDLFQGNTTLLIEGSPVRICGMHMCLDHPVMKAISRVVLALAGKDTRARYRFHEGSHTEVQYRLQSFGIPVDLIPITAEGELKKSNHTKWLSMRKAKELAFRRDFQLQGTMLASMPQGSDASVSSMSSSPAPLVVTSDKIDLPGRNDVLMGKGKPVQDHPGNVAMRALVGVYMSEYNATPKHGKIQYVRKVVHAIKCGSGRFLKKDSNGWWVLATDEEARDKISKTFTSEQAKAKKSKTVQKVDSESSIKRQRSDDEWGCFGVICNENFDLNRCTKMDSTLDFGQEHVHVPKKRK